MGQRLTRLNWQSSKQFFRQRDNMKVIVEVGAASAMLGEACHARMALAILADASEVTPSRISKEDVGAKVDGLSKPLRRRPARARPVKSVVSSIVTRTSASFGIGLLVTSDPMSAIRSTPGQMRAARTKEQASEKKRPARFSNRRHGTMGSVAAHLA